MIMAFSNCLRGSGQQRHLPGRSPPAAAWPYVCTAPLPHLPFPVIPLPCLPDVCSKAMHQPIPPLAIIVALVGPNAGTQAGRHAVLECAIVLGPIKAHEGIHHEVKCHAGCELGLPGPFAAASGAYQAPVCQQLAAGRAWLGEKRLSQL